MQFQLAIILLFVAVVAAASLAKKGHHYSDDDEWEGYKKRHDKKHKDSKEEVKRKSHFMKVHQKIKEHNSKGNQPFEMGHNEFSDWTPEERKQLAGRKISKDDEPSIESIYYLTADEASTRQLPASLDYRNDTCLGPIKNQGTCGSCWAFSSISPLEFLLCKSRKSYTALSEQQLINCACSGCNGGDYYPAWKYLSKTTTGSIASTGLAYKGSKSSCTAFSTGLIKSVSWGTVAPDVSSIMSALKKYGPLSIAMNVADSFFNYKSGVYSPNDCFDTIWDLDHAMVLVGYGKDSTSGLDYWVIRNSWGTTWGINGYMLVRRGKNTCGVETDVAYVKSNLAVTL